MLQRIGLAQSIINNQRIGKTISYKQGTTERHKARHSTRSTSNTTAPATIPLYTKITPSTTFYTRTQKNSRLACACTSRWHRDAPRAQPARLLASAAGAGVGARTNQKTSPPRSSRNSPWRHRRGFPAPRCGRTGADAPASGAHHWRGPCHKPDTASRAPRHWRCGHGDNGDKSGAWQAIAFVKCDQALLTSALAGAIAGG